MCVQLDLNSKLSQDLIYKCPSVAILEFCQSRAFALSLPRQDSRDFLSDNRAGILDGLSLIVPSWCVFLWVLRYLKSVHESHTQNPTTLEKSILPKHSLGLCRQPENAACLSTCVSFPQFYHHAVCLDFRITHFIQCQGLFVFSWDILNHNGTESRFTLRMPQSHFCYCDKTW